MSADQSYDQALCRQAKLVLRAVARNLLTRCCPRKLRLSVLEVRPY